jgi:hypothetical protein
MSGHRIIKFKKKLITKRNRNIFITNNLHLIYLKKSLFVAKIGYLVGSLAYLAMF